MPKQVIKREKVRRKVRTVKKVIKVEIFGGKEYYIARDSRGRIESRKKVEGSKLTLQSATEIFKRYGHFSKEYKIKKEKFKNFNVEYLTSSKKKVFDKKIVSIPSRKVSKSYSVQYYITARLKDGSTVNARSYKLGEIGTETKEKAREVAWTNLYRQISGKILNHSNGEPENMHKEIKFYNEGWVRLTKR